MMTSAFIMTSDTYYIKAFFWQGTNTIAFT